MLSYPSLKTETSNDFDAELDRRLATLRESGLYRELRRMDSAQGPRVTIGDKTFLNFSSNDYLGLANDPALKEAAIQATRRFGAGAGASRLVCGSLAPQHELEETLAEFKDAPAALTFSTGYATAIGALCALVGKDDIVVIDRLVHASIVDAARLSGAKLRVFAHNDLNDLEDILKWAAAKPRTSHLAPRTSHLAPLTSHLAPRTLIVTESVFSMDGDTAPLREMVELKENYGAWLMVDEAHATGIYGSNRRGLAEACDVAGRIEVHMGTLGKALGASGGYICGSRPLIDYLINRARSFIYSTAPVPAATAAATAGVQFVQSKAGEERCRSLWQNAAIFQSKIKNQKSKKPSAIVPIIIGDEARAMDAAAALRVLGIFVPAIRYPTVARGKARLRVTLTAAHTAEDIQTLADALGTACPPLPL